MEIIVNKRTQTPNKYREENDYMVGILENGEEFIFDKDEFGRISQYTWYIKRNQVCAYIQGTEISLGRFIIGQSDPKKKVICRNTSGRDYRKSNLYAGNTYVCKGDYYEGYCFNNEMFLIDADDYDLVKPHVWHVDKNGYVITKINGEVFKQHRLIMHLSKTDPREVDHIHHNQLDNRKSELRIVDRCQNCINERISSNNKSGVKGVYQQKRGGYWVATITAYRKKYYLGCFKNKEDAIQTRRQAEEKYHAEYISQE